MSEPIENTAPEAAPNAVEEVVDSEVEHTAQHAAAEPVDDAPDPRTTVLLLGAGELGRELALAFQRLGAVVVAVDRYDAPAHGVADRAVVIDIDDAEALTTVVGHEKPNVVVVESGAGSEAVAALLAVAESGDIEVLPTPRSVRLGRDREGLRRLASDELGLPTAPFWFAGSVEELSAIADHAGYPLVVKPVCGGLRGGESVMLRAEDIGAAWERAVAADNAGQARVMAESVVEVDHAITMLAIRTTGPSGPALQFCEPIGHRWSDGVVLETWQPQQLSSIALDAAKSITARIVNSLGGRGVFAVDLLVHGDDVYFGDVGLRPHDSALVTMRSQRLSEIEMHARAVLGLAVDTIMISPGAAQLTYGTGSPITPQAGVNAAVAEALATSESDVVLFGASDESQDWHRLGVALATAPDVIIARDRARRVETALNKLWQS